MRGRSSEHFQNNKSQRGIHGSSVEISRLKRDASFCENISRVLDVYASHRRQASNAATRAALMLTLQSLALPQREIAKRLGVGETYLSRLLHEESGLEIPSSLLSSLSQRLGVRPKLLEEIRQQEIAQTNSFRRSLEAMESPAVFDLVFQQRLDALHSPDPNAAKRLFLRCRRDGRDALRILLARRADYYAARTALVLNDIGHSLNDVTEAMFYARLARELLASPSAETRDQFADFSDDYVNAVYAEGLTLRLLGFHQQARKKQREIIQHHPSSHWYTHACREELLSYLLNTRIQKKTAFELLTIHRDSLGTLETPARAIWDFTARQTEASIWTGLGKPELALEIMGDLHTQMQSWSAVTNVQQASFLRLYGHAFLKARQRDRAADALFQGYELARQAGLTHQQRLIEQTLERVNLTILR